MKRSLPLVLALTAVLGGCASTYTLTLMPRNSGITYTGEAVERSSAEADVRITIGDKTYTGTWVYSGPDRASAYVSGGIGIGSRRAIGGLGTVVTVDNPQGVEAKALLRAADGSGLRCDFKGLSSGRGGSGTCQDDQGLVYDVQIRFKEYK
jgi:hypothetical protein